MQNIQFQNFKFNIQCCFLKLYGSFYSPMPLLRYVLVPNASGKKCLSPLQNEIEEAVANDSLCSATKTLPL